MTDEPFGHQPKPVSVFFEGELIDVEYWINYLKRCAEFKGDLAERVGSRGFRIFPRAIND